MSSRFSLQFWLARWTRRPASRTRKAIAPKRLGLERLELRLPPGDLFGLSMPSFASLLTPPAKPVPAKLGPASPSAPAPASPGSTLIGSNILMPPITPVQPPPANAGSTPTPGSSLPSSGTSSAPSAFDLFAASSGNHSPVAPLTAPPPASGTQLAGIGAGSLITSGPGTSSGSAAPLVTPTGPVAGPPPFKGPPGGGPGSGTPGTPSAVSLTSLTDAQGKSVVNQITTSSVLFSRGTGPASTSIQIAIDGRNVATTRTDASGHFTYQSGRLADGGHTFTAGLINGPMSSGLSTTIDTKIPSLTLTGNDFVASRDVPWVSVSIGSSDPYGYNTLVHIDVDRKHDGKFTDPGDADYATFQGTSGTLPLLPEGTYRLQARVVSNAGVVGVSNVITMQFDPYAGLMGSQALKDLASNPLSGGGPGGPLSSPGAPPAAPRTPASAKDLRFDNGRVEISARATLPKYFAGFEQALQGLGMQVLSTDAAANMVTGWFPIGQLSMLPTTAHFSAAVPVYQPKTYIGSVQTEGDKTILGNTFRATQKVDGTGVTVGVLSDSVSKFKGGLADSVKTGDLPNNVLVLKDDPNKGGTDEGRAMLEIVHDVAPGSALAFYTGFVDPTDFAAGIGALAGAGAKVINDDIGYANSPIFNDGRIALAVDQVAAQGVVYASAAGNDANQGYRAAWTPLSATVDGKTGQYQNFGGSPLQKFTLAKGDTAQITFQWDNAYLEGGDPAANFQVQTDMIVYVVDTSNNKIVATQDDNNANTDQADEFLSFTNGNGSSSANNFAFAFELKAGTPAPTQVAWIDFGSSNPLKANQENGPTTFGQPVAKGAIGVAAVNWTTPTKPEPFTSQGGGLQIYFDSLGNRLATPETRNKPNVTGPDGVHTSFFGSDDGKGGFEFFGTSAATPHVAAAAALLMQQDPAALNTDIVQNLESTTKDLLTPGYDNLTGTGLIQLTPFVLTSGGGGSGGSGSGSGDRFESNETSDAATNLGLLGITSLSYSGLTIADHPNGFSDYDWYRATTSANGHISVTMDNAALELHLFSFDGKFLIPAANGDFISASQYLYVEVKGMNIAPGVSTQGGYNMKVGLT